MLCMMLIMVCFSIAVQAASYKYDGLGRLVEVTYDSGQKITYTYDAGGNLLTVANTLPGAVLEKISLDASSYTLDIGKVHNTEVTAVYSDGSSKLLTGGVAFTSSDNTVATVDNTGKVTGLRAGEAFITAEYEGKTVAADVTVKAPQGGEGLKVQMYNGTRNASSNTVNPRFKLFNTGNQRVQLSNVKIRYYYTIDGEKQQNFWCDWSTVGSANITGSFVKASPAKTGGDYYLEIGFTSGAGTLESGAGIEIQTRIAKADWSNYTQTGDYSFNASASSYADWDKALAYLSNNLIWGEEPEDSPPVPVIESLKVQMYNGTRNTSSNTVNPRFKLYNTGNQGMELSNVKIRYYYTIDGEKQQNFWCDWSTVGSANITGSFVKASPAKTGGDYYLEIGFTSGAGTLEPGASIEIQTRIAKADWSNYTQTGDYSFNASATTYGDWNKALAYLSDNLIWGQEPEDSPPVPVIESLKVQMYNGTRNASSNTVNPRFKLFNTGNQRVELSNVKIRYYYTIDGERQQNFWCDWSTAGSANITGSFVKASPAKTGGDYYLEIGFTSGASTLEPGAAIEIQTRIAKADWSNYTQTGDYSFNASASGYVDWDKALVYLSDKLIWGQEP